MSAWTARNFPLITKAVFRFLRRYHRTQGLCAYGWQREGLCTPYIGFYSDAVRDRSGRARHLKEGVSHGYSLTIYQDYIGLPAWGAGEQHRHPGWDQRPLRFAEVLRWYEARLSLDRFFSDYAAQTCRWRRSHTVDDSERYLLTWNVLGLFAAARAQGIWTYGRGDNWAGPRFEEWPSGLDPARPEERVQFCDEFAFHTHGRVLVDRDTGETLDLWDAHLRGESPEAMARALVERAGGPKSLAASG